MSPLMIKPKCVGIHLSPWNVTVVECESDGCMVNAFEVERLTDKSMWTFSKDQVSHLLNQVESKVNIRQATVSISLAAHFVMLRRVELSVSTGKEVDDATVRFAAESTLPLPLEDMQIVVITPRSTPPAVLAVARKPWEALLQAMDDRGWVCPVVSVDAELWWKWAKTRSSRLSHGNGFICGALSSEGGTITVGSKTTLCQARTIVWESPFLHGANRPIYRELERTWQATDDLYGDINGFVIAREELRLDIDTCDSSFQRFSPEEVLPGTAVLLTVGECAAWLAACVLQPEESDVQNLRRETWRSRVVERGHAVAIRGHVVAASVAILFIIAALLYHGILLRRQGRMFDRMSRQVWAEVFPDVLPPVDVEGRLVSEHAKERALRGQDGKVPQYQPALVTLRDLVSSLPKKIPLQIHQIDLSGGTCVITGEARTHGEVESITAHLATAGFNVQPASTERTSGGTVRFTIRFRLQGGRYG